MSAIPVLVVVGATATGKSEIALALAEALGGEILSADSRQVYRHLDIGTAKPTAAERERVPHHLIDVVEPDEGFNAARFRRLALAAIDDATDRGRPTIICGGTGLYVRALLEGLFEGVPAAPALRGELHAREEREGAGTLHALLEIEDPDTAERVHPHDVFRIVRALEVGRLTGRPMSAWQRAHAFLDSRLAPAILGCARSREELAARVETRCRAMLEAGLLAEIEALWARGFGPDLPALRSVGYLEMGRFLRGEVDLESAFETFARATRRLAKRQRTWFHRHTAARWFHPERERGEIVDAARAWFENSWPVHTSISSARSPS